jgi:OmpA family/PEGA domain
MRRIGYFLTLTLTLSLCATASFAQEGKLRIKVTPKQAFVFVDGKSVDHEGSRTLSLPAGKHTVAVVNYGYKIQTQDVNIDSGKTTDLNVVLQSYGGTVNGPWGRVYLGGVPHSAVLSNGKTPDYYVGHVDEFNNDFWVWKQELILPVGHHHLTVTRGGAVVWEGDVDVQANKKVSVDLAKNTQKTVEWPRGTKLKDLPRFKAGIASATVAVAPVTGSFTSSSANINCGDSSTLTWQTTETVDGNISGIGVVAPSGTQSVSPHATTTYDFTSTGPGGVVKGTSTVNVNTKVDASISANPSDVKYVKMGDKVVTSDSTTLTWKTSNADSVSLDPGGKVDRSGTQTVQPAPADTTAVANGGQSRTVDETKNYTLNATNVCGGSSTQTAAVHITGSVEPVPSVVLQSVFYPTDYPDKRHPQVGLVRSQQLSLANLAGGFKHYLIYDPDAKLSVEAFTDVRGSKNYNQDLSERRVERIKQYLVDQGIPADKVQTAAYGKERPIDKKEVKSLEGTNPSTPPKARLRNTEGDWLAYNRRADIVLLPSGQKSAQYFPHSADDSGIIWQVPKVPLAKVEKNQ